MKPRWPSLLLSFVAAACSRGSIASEDEAEAGSADMDAGTTLPTGGVSGGSSSEGDDDEGLSSANPDDGDDGWGSGPTTFVDTDTLVCETCDPSFGAPKECAEGMKCSLVFCGDTYSPYPREFGCVDIGGLAAHGEACETYGEELVGGLDSCAEGTACYHGRCRRFCGTGGQCDPGERCFALGNGDPWLCFPRCDPLDPTACNEEHHCSGTLGGPTCMNPLDPAAPGVGQACTAQCQPGLACRSAESLAPGACEDLSCCTPYCNLDDPDPCPGEAQGEICRPLEWGGGSAPAEYAHVGVCGLP